MVPERHEASAQKRDGDFTDKWTALHWPFVGTCPSLDVRDAVDERFALNARIESRIGKEMPTLQGLI